MYLPQRHDNLTISWLLSISRFYTIVVGENDPYSGVLAGFMGSGSAKLHGEICLGSRAFGGL
jgi:hypothetical protein